MSEMEEVFLVSLELNWVFFVANISAEWPGPGVPKVVTSSTTHVEFESEPTYP